MGEALAPKTMVDDSPCGELDPGPRDGPTDGGEDDGMSLRRKLRSVASAGSSGRVYLRYLSGSRSGVRGFSPSPSNCATMTVMLSCPPAWLARSVSCLHASMGS